MIYVIGNKNFSVAVDSFGAELNSIKKCGKEMLWQNYDGSWDGHSPLLFPFCGHCAVNVCGTLYPAPAHGIAKDLEFAVILQTETEIALTASSNDNTKKLYPFDFALSVKYAVRGTTLYIEYTVKNIGSNDMFFGCGGHESFNIDGTLDEYFIEFEKEESLYRLFHDKEGYLIGKTAQYPKSKYLYFKDVPVDNDDSLIFKGIKSAWCKLVKNSGETVAKTYFKGFKNILFWRPDGAAMICIEPWSNLPDLVGETTDFREKYGITALASGQAHIIKRKITY